MREIKFRIIYQNKIVGYERLGSMGWEWMWLDLNPDNGEKWTKGVIIDSHEMIRDQFMGIDKNGVEIYEGDIYKTSNPKTLYKVVFVAGSFCGTSINSHLPAPIGWWVEDGDLSEDKDLSFIEVIGNIHANPELLTNNTDRR